MSKAGVRVSELLELVRQDYISNGKRSLYNVNLYINNQLMPALGIKVANYVRRSHVEQYKAQRKKAGASEVTINRELAVLKRAFTLGLEDELIERRPTIKLYAEPEPRQGHYERDEFLKFVEGARAFGVRQNFDGPLVADIVTFGYYSGWRLRECLSLHKDWINVKERVAVLPAAKHKNKKPKIYPLEGKVWALVEKRLQHVSSDGLLFHRGGKPVKSIRRICLTVCETVEIDGARFFHNLRRSCTTNLDRSGVEESTGMKITGHTTRKVYQNYNQHNVARIREGVRKMMDYVDGEVEQVIEESTEECLEVSTEKKKVNGAETNSQEGQEVMAERVGFEPTNRVSDYLISSQDGGKKSLFLQRLRDRVRGYFAVLSGKVES